MLDAKQIAEIVRDRDRDGEVGPSTLHYYVQVGILPPAVGRGRSGYTPEHLSRFRLARLLKRSGVGLAEIRERLHGLSPVEVAAELARTRDEEAPPPVPVAAPTRYSLAADALSARPGQTPRVLRFRGGFSLQVPPGTADQLIARLYTVIDVALNEEDEG